MYEAALRGAGLGVAVWQVCTLVSDLAAGSHVGQPWGAPQRLGLWATLTPALANGWGLAASLLLEDVSSQRRRVVVNQVLAGILLVCLVVRQAVAKYTAPGSSSGYNAVVVVLQLVAWLHAAVHHRRTERLRSAGPASTTPTPAAQGVQLGSTHSLDPSKHCTDAAVRPGKLTPNKGKEGPDWVIGTRVTQEAARRSPRTSQGTQLRRTSSTSDRSSSNGGRRHAGLQQGIRSSSPDDMLFSVDGSGGEASRVRADQIWVNDILQLLLGLHTSWSEGFRLAALACRPSTPLGPMARVTALMASLVFMVGCSVMLWRTICHRRLALTTREVWLPAYLALTPSAHQLALQLLEQPSPFPLRAGIMLLAARLGLMGISARAFAGWLPVTMTVFYSIHAWRHWAVLPWSLRVWVAVEFNLLPVAVYVVVKAVAGRLQHWTLGAMAAWSSRLASSGAVSHQRAWRVAAAVVVQQLVGILLLGMLLTASSTWADTGGALMLPSRLLDLPADTHLLPAALVAVCGLVGPLLHLLNTGVPTRGRLHQRQHSSVHPLLIVAIAATAAPLLARHAASILAAAAWEAAAAPLQTRVAGMAAAAMQMMAAAALFTFILQPGARQTMRWHAAWLFAAGLLPCLCQLAGVALGLPCRPLLQLVVASGWMAAVGVAGPMFAAGLPLLASLSCVTHVVSHHAAFPAWVQLALDAAEYGTAPLVAYWGVTWALRGLEAAEHSLFTAWYKLRGVCRTTSQSTCAVRSMSLCIVQLWIGAAGFLPLSPGSSTADVRTAAKAGMLAALHKVANDPSPYMQALRAGGAVAGMVACFLAVAALQAAIFAHPAFAAPRQRWYEDAKGRVMALGEMTMGRLVALGRAAEQEALQAELLECVRSVTEGCFPGCTLQLVVLGQQQGVAHWLSPVTRYTVRASQETAGIEQQEHLLLGDLPSVDVACETRLPIWRSGLTAGLTGYADWEELCSTYGLDSFLVVPVACSNQVQGALLVSCMSPVSLDRHQRKLAGDLAGVTGQVLYTLDCISKMHDTELLIQDALPQQVAERLRQRVVGASSTSASSLPSPCGSPLPKTGFGPCSPHPAAQHSPLNDAAVAYQQWHPSVSVLFADIVDFPLLATDCRPEQVMELLHELFTTYDRLCRQHDVYKVETVGDCYMACAGVVGEDPQHDTRMVHMAQSMLLAAAGVAWPLGGCVRVRVGVHRGRVMSGVVGSIRARYCLFGDTVNTASRMQSTGVADHIQVSTDTYQQLDRQQQSQFAPRNGVAVKGKGVMHTWLLGAETTL